MNVSELRNLKCHVCCVRHKGIESECKRERKLESGENKKVKSFVICKCEKIEACYECHCITVRKL